MALTDEDEKKRRLWDKYKAANGSDAVLLATGLLGRDEWDTHVTAHLNFLRFLVEGKEYNRASESWILTAKAREDILQYLSTTICRAVWSQLSLRQSPTTCVHCVKGELSERRPSCFLSHVQ